MARKDVQRVICLGNRFHFRNVKWERTKLPTVNREINGVFTEFRQANLLYDHDKMGGNCSQARRESNCEIRIELRHDNVPVFVRESKTNSVIAFLYLFEAKTPGNGALRVCNWRLESPQCIERPDNV